MIVLTGAARQVKAAASGKLDDLMPAEIITIISTEGGNTRSWVAGNPESTLTDIEVGKIYYAVSSDNVSVPAFIDPSDSSNAINSTQLFNVESLDGGYAFIGPLKLSSDSTSTIRIIIAGRDGFGYHSSQIAIATVSVDGAGVLTIEADAELYTVGDINLDLDTGVNYLHPKVQNTTASFVGITKWAVSVDITTAYYIAAT